LGPGPSTAIDVHLSDLASTMRNQISVQPSTVNLDRRRSYGLE